MYHKTKKGQDTVNDLTVSCPYFLPQYVGGSYFV